MWVEGKDSVEIPALKVFDTHKWFQSVNHSFGANSEPECLRLALDGGVAGVVGASAPFAGAAQV